MYKTRNSPQNNQSRSPSRSPPSAWWFGWNAKSAFTLTEHEWKLRLHFFLSSSAPRCSRGSLPLLWRGHVWVAFICSSSVHVILDFHEWQFMPCVPLVHEAVYKLGTYVCLITEQREYLGPDFSYFWRVKIWIFLFRLLVHMVAFRMEVIFWMLKFHYGLDNQLWYPRWIWIFLVRLRTWTLLRTG